MSSPTEEWPGHIERQGLIEHFITEYDEYNREKERMYSTMENKNISDNEYEDAFGKYYKAIGAMNAISKALRWEQELHQTNCRSLSG